MQLLPETGERYHTKSPDLLTWSHCGAQAGAALSAVRVPRPLGSSWTSLRWVPRRP